MKAICLVSIGLALLSLTLGYMFSAFRPGAAIAGFLGLVWLIGQYRGRRRIASLGLVSVTGLAAAGLWQGAPTGWMLLGSVAALVAWDLDYFTRRLDQAERIIEEDRLRGSHLRQLAIVAGLGLLAGGTALSFQLKLNLGWAILLAVLVLAGLGRIMEAIRKAGS